jgi:carbon-monoxide dehydrogenase large subunit
VRSTHAHAQILSVDIAAASSAPGVIAIFTGRDLLDDNVGSLKCIWQITNKTGTVMNEPPRYALAVDKVRHVGDPIAIVIAETE